eukprot:EG_transcript_16038
MRAALAAVGRRDPRATALRWMATQPPTSGDGEKSNAAAAAIPTPDPASPPPGLPGTTLFIVPTPIGHLEDVTLRALRVLRAVDVVLAEDTRTTQRLLQRYGIRTSLWPHHNANEHKVVPSVVQRMQQGQKFALVSDAGTPCISDPGFALVQACLHARLQVECLPGPTAFVPALVKSGLPLHRFAFEGFLPPKKGRQTRLRELAAEPRTVVLYESCHRLERTLAELLHHFGPDRLASVSAELTKLHERTTTAPLRALHAAAAAQPPAKGEFVIVLQGADRRPALAPAGPGGLAGQQAVPRLRRPEPSTTQRARPPQRWLQKKTQRRKLRAGAPHSDNPPAASPSV